MTMTFKKPTLKDFPATGEVTVSLKTKTFTVQIPDTTISPNSSVRLTVGLDPKSSKAIGAFEPMLVKKTPDTHPDDFEVEELRKGVTLSLSSDDLKGFKDKLVELRYTFTYEADGKPPDTSEPQMLRIKA